MVIKEVIKEKGFTIKAVAEMMGINRVALSQMVTGNPTVKTLHSIASVIGCTVGDFFKDEASPAHDADESSLLALVKVGDRCFSATSLDELKAIISELEKKP